jgi:hypothetical protein
MGNLLTDPLDHLWSMGSGLAARQRYLRDCRGVRCPCRTRANGTGLSRSPSLPDRHLSPDHGNE